MGRGIGERRKGKEEESDVETVMFVPHTPSGALAKLLQDADDQFRRGTTLKRIKMVERGGKTLKDILSRTNPWVSQGCDREECLPCSEEKGRGGNCQQEGIVYQISCRECSLSNIKAEYTGESSRTPFLRGREHLDGLRKRNEKNALWKHCEMFHGGEEVKFAMKVLRSHKTPLTRQIHESVEIDNSQAKIIMNSKGEWNGSRIPRVVIEVGEEIQEDEDDPLTRTRRVKKTIKNPSSMKEGKWNIESRRKRKERDEEINPKPKRRREVQQEGEETEVEGPNTSLSGCGITWPNMDVAKVMCSDGSMTKKRQEKRGESKSKNRGESGCGKPVPIQGVAKERACNNTSTEEAESDRKGTKSETEKVQIECGSTRPNMGVAKIKNTRQTKREGQASSKRKIGGGTTPSVKVQSVAKMKSNLRDWIFGKNNKNSDNKLRCGTTQQSTAQFNCMEDDKELCQAMESYEICDCLISNTFEVAWKEISDSRTSGCGTPPRSGSPGCGNNEGLWKQILRDRNSGCGTLLGSAGPGCGNNEVTWNEIVRDRNPGCGTPPRSGDTRKTIANVELGSEGNGLGLKENISLRKRNRNGKLKYR